MGNKKGKNNFIVQGTILAIASVVSRIIGLAYRIPMTRIIGDLGNSYYSSAFEVYNIMLLISSYSLPIAVSKFVSGYKAKGDFRTVRKIYKTAMVISLSSGTIAACLVFFGASYITSALKTPLAIYALLILAPNLIILSALGVFRGLFQGMGSMIPTAISQILEQLVNAFVSVFAAYVLFNHGARIGAVLGNEEAYSAAFGAAGGTLGTTMGALFALIFVTFIFAILSKSLKGAEKRQKAVFDISYMSLGKILILTIVPVLLSTTIYNVSGILDQFIFKNVAAYQGYSAVTVDTWWGVFSGKYKVLINVPMAIASAMAASSVPALTGSFANKDYKTARKKTYQAIRFVMVIALPCVVGLGVLASPIMQLLFDDSSLLARNLMWAGCISVAFYSLSTLSNGILQGINRLGEPVKNACIALVLHVIFLLILLFAFRLNIYAVVYANAFYALLMCILNGLSIRKYLRYRQEIVRTFIIPTICSVIMGVSVYFSYKGLMAVYSFNSLWTLVCIIIGVIVYGFFLLLLKGFSEEELLAFPKGYMILRFAKKLHLM